jgi:putative transposase
MKRSKCSDEQILAIVKESEAGRKVADLCRANGITEQTYYQWKAKYGGNGTQRVAATQAGRGREPTPETHRVFVM